jgi:hypothetical protein
LVKKDSIVWNLFQPLLQCDKVKATLIEIPLEDPALVPPPPTYQSNIDFIPNPMDIPPQSSTSPPPPPPPPPSPLHVGVVPSQLSSTPPPPIGVVVSPQPEIKVPATPTPSHIPQDQIEDDEEWFDDSLDEAALQNAFDQMEGLQMTQNLMVSVRLQ